MRKISLADILDLKDTIRQNAVDNHKFSKQAMLQMIAIAIANGKQDDLVLKGGFVVSQKIGIQDRNTKDIDYALCGFSNKEDITGRIIRLLRNSFEDDFIIRDDTRHSDDSYVIVSIKVGHSVISHISASIDISNKPEPYLKNNIESFLIGDTKINALSIPAIIAEKIAITAKLIEESKVIRYHDVFDVGMLYEKAMSSTIMEVLPLALKSRNYLDSTLSAIARFEQVIKSTPDTAMSLRYPDIVFRDIKMSINNCIDDLKELSNKKPR